MYHQAIVNDVSVMIFALADGRERLVRDIISLGYNFEPMVLFKNLSLS